MQKMPQIAPFAYLGPKCNVRAPYLQQVYGYFMTDMMHIGFALSKAFVQTKSSSP